MVLDTTYVANNATEAAQKLATYGFVVLENAVPYHVLDALAAQIHDDFAFYQRQPYLNREENLQPGCLPQRFCLNHGSNWRKPAWQDFVREVLQGMAGEVVNKVFSRSVIDTIGGDIVCKGFHEEQPHTRRLAELPNPCDPDDAFSKCGSRTDSCIHGRDADHPTPDALRRRLPHTSMLG